MHICNAEGKKLGGLLAAQGGRYRKRNRLITHTQETPDGFAPAIGLLLVGFEHQRSDAKTESDGDSDGEQRYPHGQPPVGAKRAREVWPGQRAKVDPVPGRRMPLSQRVILLISLPLGMLKL